MAYLSPSITSSGINFATFQADGPSGHLEALISAQAATANPTAAPTLAASGSGGTLSANTYYITVTETNGIGETTNGGQVSASQAVTFGQNLVVTFAALKSGNIGRNVYIGTASAGPFTCVARGITASTYSITAPVPTNAYAFAPPAFNSTGLTFVDATGVTIEKPLELLRNLKTNQAEKVWDYLHYIITNFNNTLCPNPHLSDELKLRHVHTCFAICAQLCSEAGTLIDANPGHITNSTNPIGNARRVQVWP